MNHTLRTQCQLTDALQCRYVQRCDWQSVAPRRQPPRAKPTCLMRMHSFIHSSNHGSVHVSSVSARAFGGRVGRGLRMPFL